jgi:two-component sensor histidine kinase/CheY-like chemotaxis protein
MKENKKKKKLHILILEDTPTDAELMERSLTKEGITFISKKVVTQNDYLNEIKEFCPDIILSDYNLPGYDGMSALEAAKQKCPEVPFIFVSGAIGEEMAIEALKKGATDYVLKDRMIKLAPAVERAITEKKQLIEKRIAEEKIKESLKEKTLLLEEIHHRVKNNLQIVISLLGLQEHEIQDKSCREKIKSTSSRIKSMALVHEQLYKAKNFSKVNFKAYLTNLIQDLLFTYNHVKGKIKCDINVDQVDLGIDLAIPCGLIINELVTNTIKHAFPEDFNKKCIVQIMMARKEGDSIEVVIKDNGIGVPNHVDIRNSHSLGLKMVFILAEGQLKGKISLKRQNGTLFKITFNEKRR